MRTRPVDTRPAPVRLADAELELRLDRRRLIDVERQMFEAPDDADLEALECERDDALRQVEWTRMRCHLLHDETTEYLVPEELLLHTRRAA